MSSHSALRKYLLSGTLKTGYYQFTVNGLAPECHFPFMYILLKILIHIKIHIKIPRKSVILILGFLDSRTRMLS